MGADDDDDEPDDGIKRHKVKVAVIFGYLGTNYQGLQLNPGDIPHPLHKPKSHQITNRRAHRRVGPGESNGHRRLHLSKKFGRRRWRPSEGDQKL